MGEKLGIRAAARLAGLKTSHASLYAAVARQALHADVVEGELVFDSEKVELWRKRVNAEKAARVQASIAARDARFLAVNKKRAGTGRG